MHIYKNDNFRFSFEGAKIILEPLILANMDSIFEKTISTSTTMTPSATALMVTTLTLATLTSGTLEPETSSMLLEASTSVEPR